MLVAMEGSVGYGIGGARVELEIGYERFKTKGIRDSGSKEDEADTVYLLAKELAYDVVTGQTDNLAAALAKTSGKDFVQFAKAVGVSHPNIDSKVCVTKKTGTANASNYGVYAEETDAKDNQANWGTALCGGHGSTSTSAQSTAQKSPQVLRDFVKNTLKEDGNRNWPTSREKDSTAVQHPTANDNAKAVATDLVALNPEEKTIVAGLLAKTIEGGEVVEIRAVSSTFIRIRDELPSLLPC
ncbi:surface antigen family protein [Anaplasma phagocytophilum str. NCH-1]|uniref:Surface antigen family protein n=2 Tax=Anaplasma phagocytophilum TaxID=948 RepID=A0A0F3NL46_ANAPH|nr:hypothetical protein YYU_06525 [Anaplasma phagocytophilum str. HZ2]KJV68506.1 surface antigen family protein [Anaplasma phagocytophilum str. NCH-1]KJV86438.1 surface antigen family protein [Anaplasma phagocytophilum str. ApNYW]